MTETIGFIGLGLMGAGFTKRLIASGTAVSGYDPDAVRQKEAAANGVSIAASAADVIQVIADGRLVHTRDQVVDIGRDLDRAIRAVHG